MTVEAEALVDAIEGEARTAELESRHIDELAPAAGSALWWLGAFKLVIADSLWRVARALREASAA